MKAAALPPPTSINRDLYPHWYSEIVLDDQLIRAAGIKDRERVWCVSGGNVRACGQKRNAEEVGGKQTIFVCGVGARRMFAGNKDARLPVGRDPAIRRVHVAWGRACQRCADSEGDLRWDCLPHRTAGQGLLLRVDVGGALDIAAAHGPPRQQSAGKRIAFDQRQLVADRDSAVAVLEKREIVEVEVIA